MFFDGKIYWLLNGMLFILVAFGFKSFAEDRGWKLNWWKNLLAAVWYLIFSAGFYAWGTLIGENEASAGIKIFLFTLLIAFVLGVGLWRLLSSGQKTPTRTE